MSMASCSVWSSAMPSTCRSCSRPGPALTTHPPTLHRFCVRVPNRFCVWWASAAPRSRHWPRVAQAHSGWRWLGRLPQCWSGPRPTASPTRTAWTCFRCRCWRCSAGTWRCTPRCWRGGSGGGPHAHPLTRPLTHPLTSALRYWVISRGDLPPGIRGRAPCRPA